MKDWRLKFERWRLARRVAGNPLADLLDSPLPLPSTPFDEAEFVCLDVETTGLDPRSAEMLSAGWVIIRGARAQMQTAESYIVRPPGEVGDSATVHGLTDTLCEAGDQVTNVLTRLLVALHERTLVVHFAGLDKALLDRLCLEHFGGPLSVPVVDTLALEHRLQRRRHHIDEKQSLRLSALREAYNLPRYGQHDCLGDAIATAELLLAMVATRGAAERIRLGDLMT